MASPDESIEAVQPEEEAEDDWQLPISPASLTELIAGGLIFGLLLWNAVSADTNGSKIFLPADVNLLFASPMQPQSVLMFRLAAQMGKMLLLTVYLLFQLPNLVLNLGLSVWAALAMLAAWFGTLLVGQLLQVLLYTVCSTTPRFKQHLRTAVYAFALLLGIAFLIYHRSSSLPLLQSADSFFNSPLSRWIPFWGWLKGLVAFAISGDYALVGLCAAALVLGSAALLWLIRQVHADFYEDAMAKSEETAALMEKARSEKSTGVGAVRQRKKERADTLTRDGMKRGWGANVFFWKTLYNRFRFAKFGYFTKTTGTYLAAALASAAAVRFLMDSRDVQIVALTLGGLVFFRAMGNPLEEDTGMDFFRLIPEPAWKKMLFSASGGTVNCMLDLLPAMLAASILLWRSPLALLQWLPLIVTVDFYASSVGAFIDLSVPVSSGRTVKTLIQVLFIYFGLLPDIIAIAVGFVTQHLFSGVMIAAGMNLGLGILFFLLASVYVEPRGTAYIPAVQNQDLSAAKRHFSRIFRALTVFLLLVSGLQYAAVFAVMPSIGSQMRESWLLWVITFFPQYLIGIPAAAWMLRRVPAEPPKQQKLGRSQAVTCFFITVFMMYGGNLLGVGITSLVGLFRHAEVVNPLNEYISGNDLLPQILFLVILAPIFEELLFRKLLIDRIRPYGGKTAIFLSALLFGLFHQNLSQFFYAFGIGLVFGYIYLHTGKLRWTILSHMLLNFMGSIFSVYLLNHLPADLASEAAMSSPWLIAYGSYVLLLILCAVVGFVLFFRNVRRLSFPAGRLELPKQVRVRVICRPWLIVFTGLCFVQILLSLFL